MVKLLKLAEFIDSTPGKTLSEIAAEFNVSKRTAQRWLRSLQDSFPGLMLEESWDMAGAKRFRRAKTTHLSVKTVRKDDVLLLWSLTLAGHVMRGAGFHDDAVALQTLKETLLQNVPRAVRHDIDKQLSALAHAENVANLPACSAHVSGIASKLRLAMLDGRSIVVTLKGGRQVKGMVFGIGRTPQPIVHLSTAAGQFSSQLAEIRDVIGADDLYWSDVAQAA